MALKVRFWIKLLLEFVSVPFLLCIIPFQFLLWVVRNLIFQGYMSWRHAGYWVLTSVIMPFAIIGFGPCELVEVDLYNELSGDNRSKEVE